MMASTRIVQKSIEGSEAEDIDDNGYVHAAPSADVAQQFNGGAVIKRITDSWDYCAGFGVGGFGGSVTTGKNKTSTDYMDLNGDRFPDVVTGNKIQYTRTDGSLGKNRSDYRGYGASVTRTPSRRRRWRRNSPKPSSACCMRR